MTSCRGSSLSANQTWELLGDMVPEAERLGERMVHIEPLQDTGEFVGRKGIGRKDK